MSRQDLYCFQIPKAYGIQKKLAALAKALAAEKGIRRVTLTDAALLAIEEALERRDKR